MSAIPETRTTERLRFRGPEEGDLDFLHRQFSDPEMCRYFSDPPMNREMAAQTIEFFSRPQADPWIRYVLVHYNSGEPVGTCGYHHYDADRRQVELGYDIWKDFWSQRYATEALRELIDVCFEFLAVDIVYVLVHRDNIGSRRTAEKLGFEVSEPCRPLDEPQQVCMKLSRNAWSANESGR